jgi:predicted ATP-dependent endonuclease of OLD family
MNAMQIADLCIENFRGIRIGHIRFGAHTVFIGPNNCGKTTEVPIRPGCSVRASG